MLNVSYEIPQPVEGCPTCNGTGGIYSCPIHSPNPFVREQPEQPEPFGKICLRCPWCGKDMEFVGYKVITVKREILT